jgi:hypothetical protein
MAKPFSSSNFLPTIWTPTGASLYKSASSVIVSDPFRLIHLNHSTERSAVPRARLTSLPILPVHLTQRFIPRIKNIDRLIRPNRRNNNSGIVRQVHRIRIRYTILAPNVKQRLILLTSMIELPGYHSCMRRYRHENSVYYFACILSALALDPGVEGSTI